MVSRCLIACLLLPALGTPASAQLPGAPKPVAGSLLDTPVSADGLAGRWTVTLFHGADDEATQEEMVITSTSASNLQGGFLGAAFSETALRQIGQTTVFYAQTDDGTGPIYHSGRLEGGVLTGQSYFASRKELLTWQGARQD